MNQRILLVEDERGLIRTLSDCLTGEGYIVETALDGETGARMAAEQNFDLLVLDVMLPKKNGFDLLRDLRQQGIGTPAIMLTARGQVIDKILGLKLGADDYLTKPFDMGELLARIEAVHRRTAHKPAMELEAGPLHLSLASKRLSVDGRTIDLTPTELSMLELLMRFQGQVVTRKMLCEHVWGFDWEGPTNVIEVHINRLRGKLDKGREESLIRTIRGRGYALASA